MSSRCRRRCSSTSEPIAPVAFLEARLRSCSPALLLFLQTIKSSFSVILSFRRAKGEIEMSFRGAANHSVFELNYAS